MSMIIAHNMSAINTNRQLGVSTRGQSSAMEKLSSGYKINTGKDDPSGLVISEKLRAQEVGLQRAVQNTEEAMNVVGIAEGALNEMNNILKKMKTLAVHAASDGVTSPDQIAADQAEIDSAVQTIDRIARTTKFSDQTLLAGGKEISFDTSTIVQGTQNNKLLDANGSNFDQIFRRSNYAVTIGFTGTQNADSVTGIGDVDFAKQAMKAYLEVDTAKGTLSQVDENGKFTQAQSFILTGSKGSRAFNFDKGASITEMVSMIHSSADTTGVDASLVFSSAQRVNQLDVGDYNGREVNGVQFIDAGEEVIGVSGNNITFNFLGELDNRVDPDLDFQVVFTGYDDTNNAQFNILYDGNTVVNGWDGKAGRIALGGTLRNVDLEISEDLDIRRTFGDAFAANGAIDFENDFFSNGLFKNATGGALSINRTGNFATMSSDLASVLGQGGKLEVEVVNATGAGNALNFTFNLKAYDKDGNVVASVDNYTPAAPVNSTGGATITIANAETAARSTGGVNREFFNDLALDLSEVTLNNGQAGVLIGSDIKGAITVSEVTLDNTETTKTQEVNLTPLNPLVDGQVDQSKYYSARKVDMQVDAGLRNNKNEQVLVNVQGQLEDVAAFDRAMAGIDPRLTIRTNIQSQLAGGNVTPTTYTVMFGGVELSNNWNGDASTFKFEGQGALAGLTFTIDDAASNNINTQFSFARELLDANYTLPASVASGDSYTGGTLNGGVLTQLPMGNGATDSALSDELKAYLANGYTLSTSLVDLDGGISYSNAGAITSGNQNFGLRFELRNALTGDTIVGTGRLAVNNAATAGAKVAGVSNNLFAGLAYSLTAAANIPHGGVAGTITNESLTGAQNVQGSATAWQIGQGSVSNSRQIGNETFFDALTASTVGRTASVVGGASHNDDASRTAGTIAVFGNTIAADGSGRVQRGVTNVAFERTTERDGTVTSASENIQYGLNTDGQGRVYVKFNRDNNSYSLYKDASMSDESKVAEGINGQACTEFNNSGLNGLVLDLAAGPDNDLFNEQGVYISFAGIEGRALDADNNNGIKFDGDVIGDGGRTKAGSFDAERTLVTGIELGTNTSAEGRIYMKSVYDHENGTVQVFAYKHENMSDENMVAKSEVYNIRDLDDVDYKSMSVVLSEVRNDDDTAGTGLGMVLSYEDFAFRDMTASTELVGNMTFTNVGARIYSQEYGSNAIVKVNQTQGGIFTYYDTPGDNASQKLLDAGTSGVTKEFKGQDATLSINGQKVTTDGLSLNVATSDLQARLKFNEGKAGTTSIAQVGYGEGSIFTKIGALNASGVEADEDGISGLICNAGHTTTERVENYQNGMQLQLGESSGDQDRTVISIQSMTMDSLGRVVKSGQWEPGSSVVSEKVFTLQDIMGGGRASLSSDSLLAMEIIEKSINDVTELRARLGAVQSNMLQTNSNNLAITIENIQKTESGVRDTDMASTMTEFTKQQVLQNAGMTMLSQANSASQNILQILR